MKKLLAGLDSWFVERGYTPHGGREPYWVKDYENGLRITFGATPRPDGRGFVYLRILGNFMSTKLIPVSQSLSENSSFRPRLSEDLAAQLAVQRQYSRPWNRKFTAEPSGEGPLWDEMKEVMAKDFEYVDQLLLGDFRPALDDAELFKWTDIDPYPRLIAALHLGDWDAARDFVANLEPKDLTERDPGEVKPGRWSAEEEIENAKRVVEEYIATHS